ncbi:hypothetical protein GGTG_06973 [Gaeumannomyces tritici R3-111a-1]|uniref:Uncharacterized protein n=1 Tax=Gaeumannomyces tritici (strain R3-111a-1) TaxID=644352 RepID=J3P0C6_GAET3|nr:hypothetical protein GGTG_06973 [Gaeumannomyces tritici R3-111a-1]EJT77059.1 hypothetical protein GGTG_06973 [Gaeumannomyces tritici R3-111a-1]
MAAALGVDVKWLIFGRGTATRSHIRLSREHRISRPNCDGKCLIHISLQFLCVYKGNTRRADFPDLVWACCWCWK